MHSCLFYIYVTDCAWEIYQFTHVSLQPEALQNICIGFKNNISSQQYWINTVRVKVLDHLFCTMLLQLILTVYTSHIRCHAYSHSTLTSS